MSIVYAVDKAMTADEFIDLLQRSTLAERRPVNDFATMQGMLENTNLMVTAWDQMRLIAVARSMTDFYYTCYLSDLAVDKAYQRQGIGKELIRLTHAQLKPECKLLLVSAPAANDYYPSLGFEKVDRAWVLPEGKQIKA